MKKKLLSVALIGAMIMTGCGTAAGSNDSTIDQIMESIPEDDAVDASEEATTEESPAQTESEAAANAQAQGDTEPAPFDPELMAVMDRIVEQADLGDAMTFDDYQLDSSEIGDQLITMDSTADGEIVLYGVNSTEYGARGLIVDHIINGESNMNYLDYEWSYRSDPHLWRPSTDDIAFSLYTGGGSGVMYTTLIVGFLHETGAIEFAELTPDSIPAMVEACAEIETDTDAKELHLIHKANDGTSEDAGTISYADCEYVTSDDLAEEGHLETDYIFYTDNGLEQPLLVVGVDMIQEDMAPTTVYLEDYVSFGVYWAVDEAGLVTFSIDYPMFYKLVPETE